MSTIRISEVSSPILNQLVSHLVERYQVHTVLLYGSQADGTATPTSDYDIAAFAPVPESIHYAVEYAGVWLDAFIYPEAHLHSPDTQTLRLHNSIILLQHGKVASLFLEKVAALFEAGAEPLTALERATRQAWAEKMLVRSAKQDIEGHYRKVWLLTALLEDYFAFRTLWYLGPKKAFHWLEHHDPESYQRLDAALANTATASDLAALVARVTRHEEPSLN